MKIFFYLFPFIIGFVASQFVGVFIGSAVGLAAIIGQIIWVWLRRHKVDYLLWVILGVIVVSIGTTLLLHDETFIKWKPTVQYWLYAVVLLGSELIAGKNIIENIIKSLMLQQVELSGMVWKMFNLSWIGYFTVMGFVNLYVAFNYSTDTWINFKLYFLSGMFWLFFLLQRMILSHRIQTRTLPLC